MPGSRLAYRPLLVSAALVSFTCPDSAYALKVELTAADSGFVTEAGGSDKFDGFGFPPATGNYSAGYEASCTDGGGGCAPPFTPMQRKNYFVFGDLSAVTAPVTSAKLKLFNPAGGYESGDASETYVVGATDPGMIPSVLDKITAMGMVMMAEEIDDPSDPLVGAAMMLYGELADSLGMGMMFGDPVPGGVVIASAVMTAADDASVVEVTFTPDGVMYLNELVDMGLPIVLGGAVTTADPPTFPQSVFGFTSGATVPTPTLELEILPEPGTLGVVVAGVLGLAARRK